MRCNATFGARRSDDGREYSRRKEKCLHAVNYSVEGRPTDSEKRREIIAPETGPDVGKVKSAVADPADVLAGHVSKMW
jgi:hypothetical protein